MAQIEVPNPKGGLLPGAYAYGSVFLERRDVRALPVSTLIQVGNEKCCYLVVDGKAVRTPVQVGVSDGSWVEVTGKLVHSPGQPEGAWLEFDGTEAVADGDLSLVSDGQPVTVDQGS